MKKIKLYTDGSCDLTTRIGGYCAILIYGPHEKIIKGHSTNTTNNRMELIAIIEGIKALKEPCEIDIYSDSKLCVQGINEWIYNWIKKDFKDIKNDDLWKIYLNISKNHIINMIWVKGHNGDKYNELADTIAKEEVLKIKSIQS